MSNISDTDLQMFRERAKSELASGCDVSRLRWDDIVESLCKEVSRLRKELAAGGNAAKLREALEAIDKNTDLLDIAKDIAPQLHPSHSFVAVQIRKIVRAALAEPPRNCDLYNTKGKAQEAFLEEPCDHPCGNCWVEDINNECGVEWLLAPAKKKEVGAK